MTCKYFLTGIQYNCVETSVTNWRLKILFLSSVYVHVHVHVQWHRNSHAYTDKSSEWLIKTIIYMYYTVQAHEDQAKSGENRLT